MLILLPECDLKQAGQIAETIRSKLSVVALNYEGTDLGTVTASLGVACYPHHGKTGSETIKTADQCLYQAKQAGRNRVVSAPIATQEEE
jgi:hypothetical protein